MKFGKGTCVQLMEGTIVFSGSSTKLDFKCYKIMFSAQVLEVLAQLKLE